MISEQSSKVLIEFARKVIEEYVKNKKETDPPVVFSEELKSKHALILRLMKGNEIIGKASFPDPTMPLLNAIKEAVVSASQDIKQEELAQIKIEISILSELTEVTVFNIKQGDGVMIKKEPNSGLFLPDEWNNFENKNELMNALSLKAGLSPSAWRSRNVKCYSFSVQTIKE
ncbi:hypothetical protein CL614_05545 [archaeon]|nr:hypothetical protein [archaeon]|tara:strand:+ start:4172 stop:4687 length:516 start_codon:yes stop_codon:yes gene_type:complete